MRDTVSQVAAAEAGVAPVSGRENGRAPWLLLQPSALLTAGMLVTAATVIWLSWSTHSVYREMQAVVAATALMEEVRNRVQHLDEALSMSVRMAVETGDLVWEERYRRLEGDMDAALARAREPLAGSGSLELPAHLLAANAELVATEHRVLVLVRQGRREQAARIINSDDFRQRREDYLSGLQQFSDNTGRIVEELSAGVSTQVRVQTMVGLLALAVLIASWLTIFRVLSQSERRQRLHQQRLQRHTEELAREVRDREQMEAELRKLSAMQNAILNSANYSVIATDIDGTILTFNATAERLLGYRADEVVGSVTPALIHDPKEVVRRAEEVGQELGEHIEPGFDVFVSHAKRGYADEREWHYVRKDGSRFPVLLSVTGIRDHEGHLTGFLGVASDITERKKIERMKDEFISTVSHELRTPLTSIRGALGLLRGGIGGTLDDKGKELVSIANSNSERLTLLINDILDIEKIEAGKMQFEMRPMQMSGVVARSLEEIKSYGRQYRVRFRQGDVDEGLIVNVDPDRVAQVMNNLLSNAAKYSPEGGEVTVDVARIDDYVRVSVTDHGEGIPEEYHDRLFDKFSQADGSTTREKGGTGLGLSICRAIVEQLGGRIDFRSSAGEGATFYFEVPEWRRDETSL